MAVIAIDTEESAWALLRQISEKEIDPEDITLDFSNADWLNFRFYIKGEKYHQSLTASTMKGLIDYQTANYRSIALILKSRGNVTVLSDKQKEKFELVFRITGGSTDANADGKGVADDLLP